MDCTDGFYCLLDNSVCTPLVPWGQIQVHQLGTTAHPYFISPLNPATSVAEQHHSECNSISKWTVWVMLMVVSIALGVYPQAATKPSHPAHATELFFSSIFGPNSNSSDFTQGHAWITICGAAFQPPKSSFFFETNSIGSNKTWSETPLQVHYWDSAVCYYSTLLFRENFFIMLFS